MFYLLRVIGTFAAGGSSICLPCLLLNLMLCTNEPVTHRGRAKSGIHLKLLVESRRLVGLRSPKKGKQS
jgi:hypothetical protein